MITLLVSGSRSLRNPKYAPLFDKVVERVIANGWQIIVGDADGVDHGIVYASSAPRYADLKPFVTVCGIQPKARMARHFDNNELPSSTRYLYTHELGNYTERDEVMLNQADCVYCIWDGRSRGTKHVYDSAKKLGKTAWLKVLT